MRALTARIIELLSEPATRQALPGLLADLRPDADALNRFRDRLISPERCVIEAIVQRAGQRGDLPTTLKPTVLHAVLLGAVFAWIYLIDMPVPSDLADRIASSLTTTAKK